jgi:hypothetical protein
LSDRAAEIVIALDPRKRDGFLFRSTRGGKPFNRMTPWKVCKAATVGRGDRRTGSGRVFGHGRRITGSSSSWLNQLWRTSLVVW